MCEVGWTWVWKKAQACGQPAGSQLACSCVLNLSSCSGLQRLFKCAFTLRVIDKGARLGAHVACVCI